MTDNIKKENNDANFSIDTLYVLLLVICGLAVIFVVGYLLLKPGNPKSDVITTNLIVPGTMPEENDSLESIEDSIDQSYLRETLPDDEGKVSEDEPKLEENSVTEDIKPIIPKTELKTETPSIFKGNNATLKKTPKKTTIVRAAPKQRKKLVTVKAFWIQVGSFSTSSQAKKSVEALKEKGLSSRMVLKNVNGKSVYRVRIGAYESKGEADKFCNEVKKIAGYEDSYVSETTTQKYVTY